VVLRKRQCEHHPAAPLTIHQMLKMGLEVVTQTGKRNGEQTGPQEAGFRTPTERGGVADVLVTLIVERAEKEKKTRHRGGEKNEGNQLPRNAALKNHF